MKIANPLKKYRSIEKACQDVGFDVTLPSRYKPKEIYVISNKVLELRFAKLIVRKAKYKKDVKDISGIYTGVYPNDCIKEDFQTADTNGIELWNGSAKKPKVYLSIWNDVKHKYSYSVYAPDGIILKTMTTWQKAFR